MTLFEKEKRSYAPTEKRDKTPNKPGKVVGKIDKKHGIMWTVSPHREDQRTGWVKPHE